MSEKKKENIEPYRNENSNREMNSLEQQPITGNDITEVKNANASGLGSMGRHDEEGENQEGTLQKD